MKHQIKPMKDRGFSLVEMLVVIAVIGIIAAIAVPSIGSISGKANEAQAKRNGQTIASLYNASRGVGAEYPDKTTSGIIDELVAGVVGPELAGTNFKMSSMAVEERAAAMKYVSYDSDADLMVYDPSGGQVAEEVPSDWWGDWTPNVIYESWESTVDEADQQLAAIKAQFPDTYGYFDKYEAEGMVIIFYEDIP